MNTAHPNINPAVIAASISVSEDAFVEALKQKAVESTACLTWKCVGTLYHLGLLDAHALTLAQKTLSNQMQAEVRALLNN